MSDGGKGPRIPGANTPKSLTAYEAGYGAINWNARDVPCVHGDAVQASQADGPGQIQADNSPSTGP